MVYIALLRGINVVGRNRIAMAELRAMFVQLGFAGAQSLLQSGNVVFSATGTTAPKLEQFLESETHKRFKFPVRYFVRTATDLKRIIGRNPFPREAKQDASRLIVFFFRTAPAQEAAQRLRAAIQGPETFRVDGKAAYVYYPDGQGRSKVGSTVVERFLGSSGTGRNWNTVTKLMAIAERI